MVDKMKHAVRKGLILKILKDEFPNGVDFVTLRYVLSNLNHALTEKELEGYLVYLANDRYINIKRDENKFILYSTITNTGLRLFDGYIQDEAIKF